jgi:peptidoglycan/xylan/chitin deacetylase (PgdA/CDA1 family)
MILTYHHVRWRSRDENTVSLFSFVRQMFALRRKKIVYLADYLPTDPNQIVISFDDGYRDLFKFALPVLRFFKFPFEVFIVEDFYNTTHHTPHTTYMNQEELLEVVKHGGRLQYHSKSHPSLDQINDIRELEREIRCPEEIKKLDPLGFTFFAYPFWRWNDEVIEVMKKYYKGARSGNGFAKDGECYAMDSVKVKDATIISSILDQP